MDSAVAVTYTGHHPPGVTLTCFSDGVVHAVVDRGVVLDEPAAREFRRQIRTVAAGPYVVVGDLRGVPFVDREARVVFADDDQGMVLATAVVVGREGPMRLLADRWLTDNDVRRPVATFEAPEPAMHWARQTAAKLRAGGKMEPKPTATG